MVNQGNVMDDLEIDNSSADAYRPLSGMAIAGLAFGLLSPLAFFGPPAWVVPVGGILASVIALRTLSQPDAIAIGRSAALAGLACSVGMGCAGVSKWFVSKQMNENRAVEICELWVRNIRDGHLLSARSMLEPKIRPVAMRTVNAGDEYHVAKAIDDDALNERSFRDVPAVKAILACIERATVKGVYQQHIYESADHVEDQLVTVEIDPCDGEKKLRLVLHLRQSFVRASGAMWGWKEVWEITGVEIGV